MKKNEHPKPVHPDMGGGGDGCIGFLFVVLYRA
jgi:hypothetical protein